MAWVNIKGHRYYRRSKRVGGRVVNVHYGRGEVAEAIAAIDQFDRGSPTVRAGTGASGNGARNGMRT